APPTTPVPASRQMSPRWQVPALLRESLPRWWLRARRRSSTSDGSTCRTPRRGQAPDLLSGLLLLVTQLRALRPCGNRWPPPSSPTDCAPPAVWRRRELQSREHAVDRLRAPSRQPGAAYRLRPA